MVTQFTREGVTIPDVNIQKALRDLEKMLLESISETKNVYVKQENIFDYNEVGIALLTKYGLLRIIDYIIFLRLDTEDSVEVFDRVISAIKACEEGTFEDFNQEGKIKEIIRLARK